MLQAWGRRTSPRPQSSSRAGATYVRCTLVQSVLTASVAPADAAPRELAASCTGRTSSVVGHSSAPEKPVAGPITPLKLARLSEVLLLPVTRVELILQGSPAAVRHMETEHVAQRLQELCIVLGILPKQAAFMVANQPAYMLLTPLTDISAKVQELSDALSVPPAAVLRTALTVPSILRRSTAFTDRRVKAYSMLLRCTPLDVLHVMARGPEYLSDTPSSVRQRMTALGYVLRRPRCTIAAMLQARPDLIFMSGKVMNTKVNGLMCIMNKQKHHVVTLVVKLPALLRCNLDSVRHAFGSLQVLLRKHEGFVYAMVCHAPSLLLLTPRGVHQRCAALRRCLAASPEWFAQFTQLRPPGVAQLVLNRRGSLSAMMYLTQRRRAGAAPLAQLLSPGPNGGLARALGEAWPDFLDWMQRRQQYAALSMKQHKSLIRGTAESVAQVGLNSQRACMNVPGPVQHPLSPRLQAAHAAPGGATAAAGTGEHVEDNSLPQNAYPGLGVSQLRMPLQPTPVSSALEQPNGGCSTSIGTEASSSMSGSISRASRDDVAKCEGSSRQDVGECIAAGREQQLGASSSGRQPSWLQLQAEYRRSWQSRARRQAASSPQPKAGKEISSATTTSPPAKRTRLRCKARSRRGDLLARTTVAAGLPAANGQTARLSASPEASGQPYDQNVAQGVGTSASYVSPPDSLLESAAMATCDDGGSNRQRSIAAVHMDLSGWLASKACATATAGSFDSSLGRLGKRSCLQHIGTGQQSHSVVLGSLQLPGDRQQSDAFSMDRGGTVDGAPAAVGLTAVHDVKGEKLAAPVATGRGPMLPGGGDSCLEQVSGNSATGSELTSAENEAGSSWSAGASTGNDASGKGGDAHCDCSSAEAQKISVWLHLDSSGVRSSVGGQASEGAYVLECVHQGESEVHSTRRVATPSAERPQHASTDEVVVVSGNGSICDIKGLVRDTHALGRLGQDPGGGMSIGQAQKLESVLGATVPR